MTQETQETATRVILGKERMHATHIGGDLYRLENIPFFTEAYALHDVVRAVAESEDTYPIVQELATPSGNVTMCLNFGLLLPKEVDALCKKLDEIGISSEGLTYSPAIPHYRVFNVTPDGGDKMEQVLDYAEWMQSGEDVQQ